MPCTQCPAFGATCENGIITIDENYWVDAAKLPITSDTILYDCFNTEACLLNVNRTAVSCNTIGGYAAGGVLCAICEESTHVRRGGACVECAVRATAGVGPKIAAVFVQALLCFVAVMYSITRPVKPPGGPELMQIANLHGHTVVMQQVQKARDKFLSLRATSIKRTMSMARFRPPTKSEAIDSSTPATCPASRDTV